MGRKQVHRPKRGLSQVTRTCAFIPLENHDAHAFNSRKVLFGSAILDTCDGVNEYQIGRFSEVPVCILIIYAVENPVRRVRTDCAIGPGYYLL